MVKTISRWKWSFFDVFLLFFHNFFAIFSFSAFEGTVIKNVEGVKLLTWDFKNVHFLILDISRIKTRQLVPYEFYNTNCYSKNYTDSLCCLKYKHVSYLLSEIKFIDSFCEFTLSFNEYSCKNSNKCYIYQALQTIYKLQYDI